MTTTTESPTLDTAELAKLLQCSERHIANLDNRGELPAPFRIGTLKRWRRADVNAWIAAGCPNRKAFAKL